jgi:hypothetical protein
MKKSLKKFFTSKSNSWIVVPIFTLAVSCNLGQGAGLSASSHQYLRVVERQANRIALGPTFPPPVGQDLRIALGPTFPPPVGQDLRIALGPTFPPPVGQDLRIALGPTFPPPVGQDARAV